jgi:hypothetical protein
VLPAWYLALVEFERRAWQSQVLARIENHDFGRYLSIRYSADAL